MKWRPGPYQQVKDRLHRKRQRPRYRSFICQAGLWLPQVQLQITPLCWGIGMGFSREKLALQVGPVAVAIWIRIGEWKAECHTFKDLKV